MKSSDLKLLSAALALILLFVLCKPAYTAYLAFNAAYPYITAFLKFALLATTGEAIGLRIKSGQYNQVGFGLLPRAVVWGLLGVWIAAAFKLYIGGVPAFAQSVGLEGVGVALNGELSWLKVAGALMVSTALNTTFGPVFMTLHKVTDTHILANNGSLSALIRPINVGKIFGSINWQVQWDFVFKRTIPLFWIPAHTITFLLPPQYQVLFAALLGVVLGILLSIAAQLSRR